MSLFLVAQSGGSNKLPSNKWVKFAPVGRWNRQKSAAPYPSRYAQNLIGIN